MKIGDLFPIKIFKIGGPQDKEAGGRVPGEPQKIDLATGQLLKGKVTGFTQDGKVLIDIKGQTVTAKSQLPLKVGSELWLEVKQTEPEPWLVVSDKKGAVLEFLQQALGDNSAVAKAVQTLQSLAGEAQAKLSPEVLAEFEALLNAFGDVSQGGEPDPEKVMKLVSWLNATHTGAGKGLFAARLNEQLTDLLAALQKAEAQPAVDKTVMTGLEKLTGLIEAMQTVNSQPAAPNQLPFFLIPCLFAAGAGWGQCLLSVEADSGKEGRQQTSGSTLSFFLEMSRLGDVHLQVTIKNKALRGDFVVADEAVRAHLEHCLPELKGIMEKLGYAPVYFGCRVSKDNLIGKLKAELEQKGQLQPVNILDVTA